LLRKKNAWTIGLILARGVTVRTIRLAVLCSFLAASFFSFASAQTELSLTDLDSYLRQHGYYLSPAHSSTNEGYCSDSQRQAFREDLKNLKDAKAIAEIGFNGGHSCEAFLESSDKIEVISFDINRHPYTNVGIEFMRKKYPSRFEFIPGDSRHTIKAYSDSHPGKKFDLIYIDGCHDAACAFSDIINCRNLADENTVVWIDDYTPYGVKGTIDKCAEQGLIKIIQIKMVSDHTGLRSWAEVRYLSETERAFTDIYTNGIWGRDAYGQGTSGPGSSLAQGQPFIEYVQDFLQNHAIQSVVDLGCGDWVLAQKISWGDRDYIGIDVVENLVKKNQSLYASDTIHFLHLDAAIESIPAADLLICKDMLMHLPNSAVLRILSELKRFKYCLFVNDVNPSGVARGIANSDTHTGGFRYLDLTQPPFNVVPHYLSYYTCPFAIKQVLLLDFTSVVIPK
jgi:SAM-dependent methyltransferase